MAASKTEIPNDVKQQLLQDPAVQDLIKKTGIEATEALKDPKVQAQILETCKEKFPQYASLAKDKIKDFVNDPEVQRQAKEYAAKAGKYLAMGADRFVHEIQQGPDGVRFFSFIGGVASSANAIMYLINPFSLLTHPVCYVLSAYQLLFSLTTMLFEAKPEWIQKVPGLDKYQDLLLDKAKFLSETLGRGGFYVFQGTLWLCFIDQILDLAVGGWMVFVGLLNVLIHYGGYTHFAKKVAEGYRAIGGEAEPAASSGP